MENNNNNNMSEGRFNNNNNGERRQLSFNQRRHVSSTSYKRLYFNSLFLPVVSPCPSSPRPPPGCLVSSRLGIRVSSLPPSFFCSGSPETGGREAKVLGWLGSDGVFGGDEESGQR